MSKEDIVTMVGFGVATLTPWLSWMGWIVAGGAWLLVLRLFYSTRKANLDELREANREALATIDRMEPIVGRYAAMDAHNKELQKDVEGLIAVNKAQDRTIELQAQMLDRMEAKQAELMATVKRLESRVDNLRDTLATISRLHPEIPTSLLKWDE